MASAFENRLRRTIEMAGTDGQVGPVPVMATPSGSGVAFQRKTTAVRKHLGRFKSSTAVTDDGYTHQLISEIPVGADAVQVRYYNNESAAVTIGRSIVGTTSKPSQELIYNAAGVADTTLWKNLQFGGVNSITLPARSAANIPSITESDIIPLRTVDRTDGGTYHALALRCYIATGPYSISQVDQTAFQTTPGLKTWARRKTGDFANSNYAGFTGTEVPSTGGFYAEYIFYSRGQVATIMGVGDSVSEGLYSDDKIGYLERVCTQILGSGVPVVLDNHGWHAQNSTDTWTRFKALMALDSLPDLIVYAPYNINDVTTTLSDALIDAMLSRAHQAIALCKRKRVGLVLTTGLPCDPSFKDLNASDAYRVTFNQRLISLGSAAGVPVVDIAAVVSGITDADGQVNMLAGTSGDGVHPNATGNGLIASVLYQPMLDELRAALLRQSF